MQSSASRGRLGTRSTTATRGAALRGLRDRSRRPQRHANQLRETIEKLIVRLKREYPTCGREDSGTLAASVHADTATGHQRHGRRLGSSMVLPMSSEWSVACVSGTHGPVGRSPPVECEGALTGEPRARPAVKETYDHRVRYQVADVGRPRPARNCQVHWHFIIANDNIVREE